MHLYITRSGIACFTAAQVFSAEAAPASTGHAEDGNNKTILVTIPKVPHHPLSTV